MILPINTRYRLAANCHSWVVQKRRKRKHPKTGVHVDAVSGCLTELPIVIEIDAAWGRALQGFIPPSPIFCMLPALEPIECSGVVMEDCKMGWVARYLTKIETPR